MADQNPDFEFIKRCVDQYELEWRRFYRNLAIAAIVIFAFQCITVPRFVQLSEELPQVKRTLDAANRDLQLVKQTETRLDSAYTVVRQQLATLQQQLDGTVDELRTKISRFSDEINQLRDQASRSNSPDDPLGLRPGPGPQLGPQPRLGLQVQQQQQQQQQMPQPAFFSYWDEFRANGLLPNAEEILSTADPESDVFKKVVVDIVNRQIVGPVFRRLNDNKNGIVHVLDRERDQVLSPLVHRGASAVLSPDTAAMMATIQERLDAAQLNLKELVFNPPPSPEWWRTVEDKQLRVKVIKLNTSRVSGDIERQLSSSKEDVLDRADAILQLQQQTLERQAAIETELAAMDEQIKQTEQLLGLYSKPLPLVAVQAADLIPYYPVFLAIVVAYFISRFVLLQTRSLALSEILEGASMAKNVTRAYWPWYDFASGRNVRWGTHFRIAMMFLLGAFGIGIAGISLRSLLTSTEIAKGITTTHYFLYACGALAVITSVLFAIGSFVRAADTN